MNERLITACPVCGAEGKRDFLLGSYSVRFCSSCRFRWTENIFAESVLEEAVLEWFRVLGWSALFGPAIAPGESTAERDDYGQAVLVGRLGADGMTRRRPAQ